MSGRWGSVMHGDRPGPRLLGLLAAATLLVTGCATTEAASVPSASQPSSPSMSMAPGMTMAPGMRLSGMGGRPSATARMVCGSEIRQAVAGVLGLPAMPAAGSTWSNGLFSCTYRLASGPLVLSVDDSDSVSAGRRYFTALEGRASDPQPLRGLQTFGLPSFRTAAGTVAFLKDGKTLVVDATAQSGSIGQHHLSPSDLAYAVAADVIACWSE